ncbi:unnamed protein product [Phyllotreta striolata]|uniref:Uncharacterized protein n=1 Tax=Phyllotreta striolata TaxID=444603 RepID=A0A9N9TQM7_PHYSR|nr:unnamed protein product [Phyllotreta striolata]
MIEICKLIFVIAVTVKITEACNGYNLKVNRISTCIDDSIVVPHNVDLKFDPNCNLIIEGCIEMVKPTKWAKGTYEANKSPMPPMKGPVDMCQILGDAKVPQAGEIISAFGLPKKCPLSAKKYCVNGKKSVNISAFKKKLTLLAGQLDLKFDVEHDSGKSCVDINITVSKRK